MLATGGELPTGPGWAYELKWDGVRALAVITERRPGWRLFARSGAEVTAGYPELAPLAAALRAGDIDDAVLDGEIVALGEDGRPNFMALAERMHVREAGRTAGLATTVPVTYMIFDLLRLNGTSLLGVPYRERRELLEELA